MSRRLELAPFAVTSDGSLFLNVAVIASATELDSVVRAAAHEKRAIFIGVMLTPEEADFAMARLDNAADEAAARIVGARARRRPRN